MIESNELPSGWIRAKLQDVLPLSYGKGLTEKARDNSGSVPVYGSSGIVGRHTQALTTKKTLVVGRKGSVGEVYYSLEPCWAIDTTYFVEDTESTDLKYWLYLLKSLGLERLDRSTAIPGLSRDDYNEIEVSIAPLPEQHRIVAEIETQFTRLDASVAALKRVQVNLKRYRASVLHAACEGRLVPIEAELARAEGHSYEPAEQLLQRILQERRAKWEADQLASMKAKGKLSKNDTWKSKYKEPVEPDTSELPELPDGWRWVSLSQVAQVERGKFQHRPRNDPRFYNGPYPFVQIGDLPREGGLITEFKQTLNETGFQISRLFKAETILIAIVGATIANTGVLSFDACAPDSLVAIRGYFHQMTPFIDLYLRERKHRIRSQSYASGGQPNINLELLNPFPVPLPPVNEQHRIIAEVERRFSVIDELKATIDANLKRADRLRQSILKRAFEGKLVLQDPTDEPASVLLERIQAEREQAMEKPRATRKTKPRKRKVQPESAAPVQSELALEFQEQPS